MASDRQQRLAQRVQRLVEPLSSSLFVGVGPQEGEQTVARHAAMSGGGQNREQCESTRLGGGASYPGSVSLEVDLT